MIRPIKCLLILLLVFAFIVPSNAQKLIHDTLFLKREIKRSDSDQWNPHDRIHYSGVFIEKNKSSSDYKFILNYNFKKIILLGNFNPNGKIDTNAMKEIPRKWYPVRLYKGKYYVLSQDFYNKDLLTDTAYISRGMEGAFSNGLNSFKKINKNTYQLNANTWHNKTFTIRIHIIDSAKELAVFEYFGGNGDKHSYSLMVGGDNVKLFPLAVSFSRTKYLPDKKWYAEKPEIFMTDKINYPKLLDKK